MTTTVTTRFATSSTSHSSPVISRRTSRSTSPRTPRPRWSSARSLTGRASVVRSTLCATSPTSCPSSGSRSSTACLCAQRRRPTSSSRPLSCSCSCWRSSSTHPCLSHRRRTGKPCEASNEYAPMVRSLLEARLKVQGGLSEKLTDWLAEGITFEVSPDAERRYNGLLAIKRPPPPQPSDFCTQLAPPLAPMHLRTLTAIVALLLTWPASSEGQLGNACMKEADSQCPGNHSDPGWVNYFQACLQRHWHDASIKKKQCSDAASTTSGPGARLNA
ncbi:hypothetical protein V8E36_009080 [Tilletia maclaganii]